jgi:hypothetical protein
MTTTAALLENGHLNPGYLKLDLLCKGMRVAPDAFAADHPLAQRVRAGLGSGLEMHVPRGGGMMVNVPIDEAFASESPYELHAPDEHGRRPLTHGGRELCDVVVPPPPRFYRHRTSSGKRMGEVGVIQGSYLGIYYGETCANWKRPAADACRFCGLGTSGERTDKITLDVVETALAARRELGITFVHVNGGFDDRGRYVKRFGTLMRRLSAETGLLLGLQIPPLDDVSGYRAFREAGVNNVSLCFELWDPDRFEHVCPGKHSRAGLEAFKRAIRWCVEDVGFDTTNGELIAGLEDPARSCEAIDWLTEVGAVPTVCVFRPLAGTPLADEAPPETEAVLPVLAHAYRRCMERGLPIGIAPNVHVSIVMTPDECRWLLPPGERSRWKWRRLRHATLRRALGAHVRRRARRASSVLGGGR